MAERSDLTEDVSNSLRLVEGGGTVNKNKEYHRSRRVEALSLALAGLTYEQIGERLNISTSGAADMVKRTLAQAENRDVETQRDLENARLDRAQAAIWSKVLEGDIKAVDSYLRISKRRSDINGMDAPQKLDINMSVKHEMEKALADLEEMVTDVKVLDDKPALDELADEVIDAEEVTT